MANLFKSLGQALNPFSKSIQTAGPAGFGASPGSVLETVYPVQVRRLKQDVQKWRDALDRAENVYYPERVQLLSIYADVVLDPHLTSVLQTRKINVLGKAFKLVDSAGQENPKLTKLLQRPWFRQLCEHALDSKFYGHSLVEFATPVDGEFHRVTLINRQYVFPEAHLVRSMPGMIVGVDYANDPEYAPWILEIGSRHDLGLLLKAAPPVIWKKTVLAAWSDFTEMFGTPYRAVSGTLDGPQMDACNTMMATMGQAGYGIFPEGAKIDFIAPAPGNDKIFDTFINRINSELSKLVLGQTMTTDSGSSRSQGEVHERVADAYTKDDATWLAEWVNETLLPFLLVHGYAVAGYEFAFDDTETLSKTEQFAIVQGIMQNSGYQVSKQYLEDTFGVVLEDKPEPAIAPPLPPGKPQGPPTPTQPAKTPQAPTASLSSQISALYAHACPRCSDITWTQLRQGVQAAAGDSGKLNKLAERLIKAIHSGDLFNGTIDQPLYHYLRAHLEDAVQLGFGVADEKLRGYLLANVQKFSGFKTAAVQRAMSEKLTDAKGNIRPFAEFRADALEVNQLYNVDYLRTEYNQAIASSQMAAKWSEFDASSQIRYDTVGDNRVREEHAALDGITRPHDDPFWDDHYPPLDWNCRCSATELDSDATATPAHELPGLPEAAEGFRENVGKTGVIFGADHPYFQLPAHEARKIESQL
ncbi:DUF935 family protein [Hymenobacter sp. BRD128]|uniref:phage portal protein family protein n=1 Tax=Hymenobacter sp. BRD128 TaxID=2675878 RepID=UPI001565E58B|nr:DUF935 family protein [Hymenobacter sp. BRD128]QKG56992.1 DUF935 family protein [Hymenobacter sp. BRD128]